jgi:hypothetical protein
MTFHKGSISIGLHRFPRAGGRARARTGLLEHDHVALSGDAADLGLLKLAAAASGNQGAQHTIPASRRVDVEHSHRCLTGVEERMGDARREAGEGSSIGSQSLVFNA